MAKRNVVDFKIINLSEEKFQELKEAGQIDPNALYATPDTTKERLDALEGRATNLEETKQDEATAVNYDNITNCITEIPQDIKLELADGVLTLKAGSKVYVPNGAGVFDAVTTTADASTTRTDSQDCMVWRYPNGSLGIFPIQLFYSGATAPTEYQFMFWYDTTNNLCKITNDSGSTWTTGASFPICVVKTDGTKISAIKQVFNGFGYVGSTVFALPMVKGLIPNGRNADGSLKNTSFINEQVVTVMLSNGEYSLRLAHNYLVVGIFPYDPITNRNYNVTIAQGNERNQVNAGNITVSNGRITLFNPKPVFHAVDYSDTEFIAHQAMPSKDRYIALTLGASGTAYTAPADGYIKITKNATAAGQFLDIYTTDMGVGTTIIASGSQALRGFCPVSKGDRVTISYTAAGTTGTFRFVYANGAK